MWIKSGGLWVSPTAFMAAQEYSPTCLSVSARKVNEWKASKIPALTSCSNRWFCWTKNARIRAAINHFTRRITRFFLPLSHFYSHRGTKTLASLAGCFVRRRPAWDRRLPSKCPTHNREPNEQQPPEHLFAIREWLRHCFIVRYSISQRLYFNRWTGVFIFIKKVILKNS